MAGTPDGNGSTNYVEAVAFPLTEGHALVAERCRRIATAHDTRRLVGPYRCGECRRIAVESGRHDWAAAVQSHYQDLAKETAA